MNIGLVTSEFFFPSDKRTGGLGTYIYKTAKLLSENNHTVHIFWVCENHERYTISNNIFVHCVKTPSITYSTFDRILNKLWVILLGFSYYYRKRNLVIGKHVSTYIQKIHQENHLDLIQYPLNNTLSLTRPENIPAVIRISSLTNIFSSLGGNYSSVKKEVINSKCELEKKALFSIDGIFGPCEVLLKEIIAKPETPVCTIQTPIFDYNSVDNTTLKHPQIDTLSEIKYLLFFGNISYGKGADLLIDTFLKLNYPDLTLVLAGSIQKNDKEGLKISAQIEKNKTSILYLGSINKCMLADLIKNALAIVLPSRVDNFPNSLVESLACGKIIVGPDSWGFEQVLINRKNGFLFKSGSRTSLEKAIKEVYSLNVNEIQAMENMVKETAQELCGKKVTAKLISFYEHVISKKRT